MISKSVHLAIMAPILIGFASALVAPRSELPCYNFADPDHGVGNYCLCSNGASVSNAPSTGTNTGTNYNPCPYTEAPSPTTTSAALAARQASPTPTQLPCYNYADPDQGVGDFCMCSNGISTPIAASTGTNTGTNYQPCPYTVAPTSQVTSISTPGSPSKPSTTTSPCTDEPTAVIGPLPTSI